VQWVASVGSVFGKVLKRLRPTVLPASWWPCLEFRLQAVQAHNYQPPILDREPQFGALKKFILGNQK
jgi:hypothetical protein